MEFAPSEKVTQLSSLIEQQRGLIISWADEVKDRHDIETINQIICRCKLKVEAYEFLKSKYESQPHKEALPKTP